MFTNPVRDAGLGGFEWRDQTILEDIKSSKITAVKPSLYRVSTYLATGLAFLLMVRSQEIYLLIVMLVLVAIIHFSKLYKTLPQGYALYGLAVLTPLVVGVPVAFIAISAIGIALLALLVDDEPLLLGSLAIGASAGTGNLLVTSLVTIAVVIGWTIYSFKTNHLAPWLALLSTGKKNLVSEPIKMPVGYHKAGTQALKKSLRSNSDRVSARHRGSVAERVTALELRDLPPGSAVYHDIALPGADDANIDHLAITPNGVFVIDTKLFAGRITQKSDGSIVKVSPHGEQNLSKITQQMQWARDSIEKQLRGVAEVKAVVAIQRATLDQTPTVAKDKNRGNVAYMPLENCISIIQKFPAVLEQTAIDEIVSELKAIVGERKPVYAKK